MAATFRNLMWRLLNKRGGRNKILVIRLLQQRPYNRNQLAEKVGVTYRSILGLIDTLQELQIVETIEAGYGQQYALTTYFKENIEVFDEVEAIVSKHFKGKK